MSETFEYNETRFACTCGRFIPESAIRSEDRRDDSTYYGVSTTVEWDCGRCGVVRGEGTWEPPLVVVATRTASLLREPETTAHAETTTAEEIEHG